MNRNQIESAEVSKAAGTVAYRSEASRSKQLYQRAVEVMPGGNSRHSIALAPYPVYVRSGKGCRVVDVEGEERIDFLNNFTSLILGHADPQVTRAVRERVELGTAFTMPTEADVELAELLVERVPYIDQIRFCNSGSEAVMLAVKAARAFTGKAKIAKFEGAYHGIYDYVQVSEGPSAGSWGEAEAPASVVEPSVAPSVANEVVVLPWNNFKACQNLIEQNRNDLAAVVIDPLPLGVGLISPQPGFVEFLRELTERCGVLLICDEVLTFRLSYSGAMSEFGVAPDLTTFGKIIGGGFPVGAIAGKREVMSVFDHTGDLKVHHGGTFNANPVTMTAGLAAMRQMTREAYDRLNRLGDYIRDELTRTLGERGIPAQVCGKGSLFLAHLTEEELVDYRSVTGFSRTNPVYGALCHEMLARGVVTTPRGIFGCLSTPMSEAELDVFVEAVDGSLTAVDYKA
jgi:glutamate-1-semialdehyde 2,1-aminomutase